MYKLPSIRQVKIMIQQSKLEKKDEEIRYIYNNKKIYKNINQRGNITLLNNVVFFKIIKTNNNILKIKIKQGDTNYYKEKNLYL